jgi:competence protein ComEC
MMPRTFTIAAYPFLLLLTALVAGIVLQQQLCPPLSGLFWLLCCAVTIPAAILLHYKSILKSDAAKTRNVLLVAAFSALGGLLSYHQNIQHDALWYGRSIKEMVALKVEIAEAPILKPKTTLLCASVNSIYKNNHWQTAKGDIKIYVYNGTDPLKFKQGQTLIIPNELTKITSSKNPFSFDQALYASRNNLFHQCFLSADQLMVYDGKETSSSLISSLRTSIQASINKNVQDSTTKGLINAMLLNDRANLDDDLQQAYVTTGIIHILAISGMHVLLLAGIILWLFDKIPIRHLQRYKYPIALLLVWIYIAITGFPPSANRSAVMFTIFAIGISLNKDRMPLNTWAASGFLLLCYNPYWLYNVGFQLSFLAVLSILLFNTSVMNWWKPSNRLLRSFWSLIAMSISVQVLVFPLVIYYFNQFPILVFLANIPAGLYSTILMIGSIIIFILNTIGISALWIGSLLTAITKAFNAFVLLLSSYSPESFRMLFIDALDYWLMMLAIIFCCFYLYFKNRIPLYIGLTFAILLILNFIRKDITALHQERIVVYNFNKESQVDIFRGKQTIHVYPTNDLQDRYALKSAQLGFHTSSDYTDSVHQSLFNIHDKRILLLHDTTLTEGKSFPVDVLVISKDCIFDPERWFNAYHPKKIIIDGSLSRTKAIDWKARLERSGAKVHAVTLDGAWVYPSL